ncbi:MAG TPA: PDZ domain-containing protein [Rickettsiales bacterium]|nr:PDZ domain-containing protein [Rickettsiales bacterium]
MRRGIVFFLLCILTACANPYSQFYQGAPDARVNPYYEALSADIQVYPSNNFTHDIHALIRKGYFVIGYSAFEAPSASITDDQARAQAKKIGAQIVLVSSHYSRTVSGVAPVTIPTTSTSYSTANATAYGPGGVVNAYGTGTTTTYGSETLMMPYSIQRSEFGAVYLAKAKARLGLFFDAQSSELDIATRKRLNSNGGLRVSDVVEGTPAFEANIFPGDILLSVEGDKVYSQEQYGQLLNKYEGQSVTLKLYRDGKILKKEVKILSVAKEVITHGDGK